MRSASTRPRFRHWGIGLAATLLFALAVAWFLDFALGPALGERITFGEASASAGRPVATLSLDAHLLTYGAVTLGFVALYGLLVRLSYFGLRNLTAENHEMERKNLELQGSLRTLTERQERIGHILNSAGEGICGVDTKGRITFVNKAVTQLTGWHEEELIGRPMHVTMHQPRADGTPYPDEDCPIRRTFINGEPRHVSDEVFWRRNLASFPVEYTSTPIYQGEQLTGAVVVFRNVSEHRRAAEALRESENVARTVIKSVNEGIMVFDRDLRYKEWNSAMEDMTGLPADQIVGASALDLFPQFMIPGIDRLLLRALRGERVTSPDTAYRVPQSGKEGWMVATFSPHTSADGKTIGVVGIVREISARKSAEQELRASEERYALAASAANDGLWDWDLRSKQVYYSPRWKSMLGYQDGEISQSTEEWFSRVHPEDLPGFNAAIGKHIQAETDHFESEHRMLHRDGSYRWMLTRGLAMRDEEAQAYRMAGSQTDITDRRMAGEQLLHDAFHDGLTGLPNRALFTDRLDRALERAKRREDYMLAVLFLDLDRFKVVNDSLGHLAGDQLLIGVGKRLAECLRQVDTVARLGGDEFVILLEDINGVEDATRAARRIQEAVSLPFDLGENELFTTASIGIAVSSSGYDQAQDILRDADIAMYRAKALGKARYELFDKSMHGRAVELLQLETDLRRAVERHEFRLFYQPIVLLGSGQIIGFEALIRWMHPQRGLTQPAAFLPLAEETGLSVPMGQWVLRQACRQLRLWKDRLPAGQPLAVSINLSSKQLLQPGLTKIVQEVLEEFEISPPDLHLEITEGVIMAEPDAVVSKLAGLRSLGVKLPIDDFGTGYSSLAYLHRFPISGLKIDRSFVTRVAENEVIVRTIVSLAHNLGMEVIAEGVETQGQADRLLELGCEYAQGFFFSRPVEAEAATALLLAPVSVPA